MTSNDDQEFCLHRFAAFQKLRNNHNNKDYVPVFSAVRLVYPAHFLIKLCYSRGNLNTISGKIPHQVGSLLVVRHKIMTLLIACTLLLCVAAALAHSMAVPNVGASLLCGDQCRA